MYSPLTGKNVAVRRRCLAVLSHLILSDMMKVKGNIARIALCMRSEEEEGISQMVSSKGTECEKCKKVGSGYDAFGPSSPRKVSKASDGPPTPSVGS
jgi:hypothetical protein